MMDHHRCIINMRLLHALAQDQALFDSMFFLHLQGTLSVKINQLQQWASKKINPDLPGIRERLGHTFSAVDLPESSQSFSMAAIALSQLVWPECLMMLLTCWSNEIGMLSEVDCIELCCLSVWQLTERREAEEWKNVQVFKCCCCCCWCGGKRERGIFSQHCSIPSLFTPTPIRGQLSHSLVNSVL